MQDDDSTLQVMHEEATLRKRDVTTGRVRVSTRTETADELVSANLDRHDVEVRRVTIERDVVSVPPTRTEGDVTIIPVVEEILVVEKRLVLREEIHIRQIATTATVELPMTLRKQRVVIGRVEPTANPSEEEPQQ